MVTNIEAKLLNALGALNVNLTDIAKSLRVISVRAEEYKNSEDYWHPTLGPLGSLPISGFDWVLVMIKDDVRFLPNNHVVEYYSVPRIAQYRSDENWWSQETNKPYGTEEMPFEVIYWRPIPYEEVK